MESTHDKSIQDKARNVQGKVESLTSNQDAQVEERHDENCLDNSYDNACPRNDRISANNCEYERNGINAIQPDSSLYERSEEVVYGIAKILVQSDNEVFEMQSVISDQVSNKATTNAVKSVTFDESPFEIGHETCRFNMATTEFNVRMTDLSFGGSLKWLFQFRPETIHCQALQRLRSILNYPFTNLNEFFKCESGDSPPSAEERMSVEWMRLQTFQNYPVTAHGRPSRLAREGFFYTGQGTQTRCFSCGVSHGEWNFFDNPHEVHWRLSPNCPILNGRQEGHRNIPMSPDGSGDVGRADRDSIPTPSLPFGSDTGQSQIVRGRSESREIPSASKTTDEDDTIRQQQMSGSGETTPRVQSHLVEEPAQSETDNTPKFPEHVSLPCRIATFSHGWPPYLDQTPQQMAEAGFFFTGNQDYTRCYQCGGGLRNWGPGDNPWIEHCRWYSTCPHVEKGKGQRFVNAVLKKQAELLATQRAESRRKAQYGIGSTDPLETLAAITLLEMGYPRDTVRNSTLILRRQREPGAEITALEVFEFICREEDIERQQQMEQDAHSEVQSPSRVTSRNPIPWTESDHIRSPQYQAYNIRLSSFAHWSSDIRQSPEQVADAGFYYTGLQDVVRCFACGGGLKNWDPEDDPWIEHARWFPQCAFVKHVKGQEFIDLVRRMAEDSDEDEDTVVHSTFRPNNPMADLPSLRNELNTHLDEANAKNVFETDAAKCVLDAGYSKDVVARTINELIIQGNVNYTSIDIMEIILEKEYREEPATEAHGHMNPLLKPGTSDSTQRNGLSKMKTDIAQNDEGCEQGEKRPIGAEGGQSEVSQVIPAGIDEDEGYYSLDSEEMENEGDSEGNVVEEIAAPNHEGSEQGDQRPSGAEGEMSEGPRIHALAVAIAINEDEEFYNTDSEEMENKDYGELEEENKKLKEQMTCKICMENPVRITFLPCGHLVCCEKCAPAFRKCPICRICIQQNVKTYL